MNKILTEILSGCSISLVMIPEAIAFALLIGLSPAIGLSGGVVMTIINALTGSQPGMISGTTAAVALGLVKVVSEYGFKHMIITVIIAGIIQIFAALLGLHKLFAFIPKSVTSGFLLALAGLIFIGQLDHFRKIEENNSNNSNNNTETFVPDELLDKFVIKRGDWMDTRSLLYNIGFTLLGIIFIILGKYLKLPIPPSIIAVVLVTVIFYIIPMKLPIKTIGDMGDIKLTFEHFKIVKFTHLLSFDTFAKLLPYALTVAITGLTETLLLVRKINGILSRDASTFIETLSQGIANISSGMTGGMGGCALVGQSLMNISHGATMRISALTSGIILCAITFIAPSIIEKIPLPSLIASMLYIVYETGDWKALASKVNGAYVEMIFTICISLISHNLTLGVIVGIAIHLFFKLFS